MLFFKNATSTSILSMYLPHLTPLHSIDQHSLLPVSSPLQVIVTIVTIAILAMYVCFVFLLYACMCMFVGLCLLCLFCICIHSHDLMYVGSLSSSVGLGICVIEHLSIESSVVDGSTIRVAIIIAIFVHTIAVVMLLRDFSQR